MASEAQWQILISAKDDTSAAFGSLKQSMKQAQGVMDGVTKSIDAIKTAAAGFAGMKAVEWFKDTAKAAAEVEELGKKFGFTSDQVEAMQKSAEATGQTFDQQAGYFKDHRDELEKMTGAYRAQGQLMSGPVRTAFADVNQQLEVLNRTMTTVRAQFEGGSLDKGISLIAGMIKDMGASLAYFEVYKGTITSVRELLALFTGGGAVAGVTAEQRAQNHIRDLQVTALETEAAYQKAEAAAKRASEQQAKSINGVRDSIFKGSGANPGANVTDALAAAERARKARDDARQAVQDAEAAYAKGKAALDTAQENPARPVPVIPPPMSFGSNAGEESAAKKLAILVAERQALERAMGQFRTAFEARQTDTVEEVDKKLQRSVDLEKQIATLTKNVGRDSGIGQQIAAEATALSELNNKYDEYKRVVTAAEQTSARYGDGSRELARTQKELGKQLAENQISQEAYNWAMKDAAEKAKQQELAARGAAGGFGGFAAGIESVLRPANQMSREFMYGQKAMQLLDDAINQMVNNGEVNFNRLLASFITTIAQMEARAAISSLWKLASGDSGGGGGGGWGGIIGGIVSIGGALLGGGGFAADGMATGSNLSGLAGDASKQLMYAGKPYAEGGRPEVGKVALIGEQGPELWVPDSSGTIIPNDQLFGGGDTVQVNMSNSFGGGVTHAEMLRYGALIEERAKAGAMAGIEAKRKRGGSIKQVFRG